MELKPSDSYCVEISSKLTEENKMILQYLYTPIIGVSAVALYNLLINENAIGLNANETCYKLQRICSLLGIKITQLEKYLQKLTAINLVRAFMDENDECLVFFINLPMSATEFLNHRTYGKLLLNKLDKSILEQLKKIFIKTSLAQRNLKDISTNFSQMEYDLPVKSDYLNTSLPPGYNWLAMKLFLDIKEKNISLEDDKLIASINKIVDKWNPSQEELGELILNSFNKKNNLMDYDKFIESANKKYINLSETMKKTLDLNDVDLLTIKSLDPERFILSITGQKNLFPEQKELIDILKKQFALKNDVINSLINYSWIKNDQRIVANYLYKIAQTFNSRGISDAENAAIYFDSIGVKKFVKIDSNKKANLKYSQNKLSFDKKHDPNEFINVVNQKDENQKQDLIDFDLDEFF